MRVEIALRALELAEYGVQPLTKPTPSSMGTDPIEALRYGGHKRTSQGSGWKGTGRSVKQAPGGYAGTPLVLGLVMPFFKPNFVVRSVS